MSAVQSESAAPPTLHPIQLIKAELSAAEFKAFRPSDPAVDVGEFTLAFARSTFSDEHKRIDLTVKAEAGDSKGEGKTPYYLMIEVRGHFRVDESVTLSTEKIEKWAELVAPYVLLPYLREQVYAFSIRTGFAPLTLPLYQLPTLKLEAGK